MVVSTLRPESSTIMLLASLLQHTMLTRDSHRSGLNINTAVDHLPKSLLGPEGASYRPDETPFCRAMGTNTPIFDWLAERLPLSQVVCDGPGYPGVPDLSNWDLEPDDQGLVSRPEMGNFALAMVAGGKTSGAAHAFGKRETLDGLGSPHINAWCRFPLGRPGRCSRCRCRRRRWFVLFYYPLLINIRH